MFDVLVVCYLFLGGLGGGLCLALSLLGLAVPPMLLIPCPSVLHRRFFFWGYTASGLTLMLASLCLLADAGNYEALPHLFFSGRLSYLSFGAYALVAGMLATFGLAFYWKAAIFVRRIVLFRAVLVLAAFVGLLVTVYTGLFLASMRSVPLWHTPWLPVLFVLSSFSCGLTAVPAIARLAGVDKAFEGSFRRTASVDACALILEALCTAGLVATALLAFSDGSASAAARFSVMDLILGEHAVLFWIGFVTIGLVVAFVLEVRLGRGASAAKSLSLVALACVLAGAFTMRYCLVMAGTHPAMNLLGA